MLDEALDAIVTLTEDDRAAHRLDVQRRRPAEREPAARWTISAPPSGRVYDLRQLWRSMGPRVETVRKEATPGRNDPCPCGSGKKYKKCHGE